MNERIKELAEEAGLPTADYYVQAVIGPRDIQKFAELIVKECIAVYEYDPSVYHEVNIANIKEHFGVTE